MSPTITQRVVANARKRGVDITTRKKWGKDSPDMGVYVTRRKTHKHAAPPSDTLWCHITVTHGYNDQQDEVIPIETCMQVLHGIGLERFGSGVSYNFGVHALTGKVGVGMPLDAKGTHTVNTKHIPNYSYDQNLVSLAIAFIGMPGVKPSEEALDAYAGLIAALIEEGALTKGFDFNPHSMVAPKDCPTDNMRDAMPEIRRRAFKQLL